MIHFKNGIYLLIMIVLLHSCNSVEIDYIKPVTAKKLVAHCFFNPDSIWQVQVSKLGSVTDVVTEDLLVNNAIVTIYENEKLIDTLKLQKNGYYTSVSNRKPEYNKMYQLQVECNGFEKIISTEESLPAPMSYSKYKVYSYLLPNIFSKETYNDTLWYKQKTIETMITLNKGQFFKVSTIQPSNLVEWSVSVSLSNKTNLIEYNSLNGNIFESQNSMELLLQAAVTYNSNELHIMTISPHYLLYEVSYAEYEYVVNTTKILTPNNVYSNISGGGGIFVGYTLNSINLKRYN